MCTGCRESFSTGATWRLILKYCVCIYIIFTISICKVTYTWKPDALHRNAIGAWWCLTMKERFIEYIWKYAVTSEHICKLIWFSAVATRNFCTFCLVQAPHQSQILQLEKILLLDAFVSRNCLARYPTLWVTEQSCNIMQRVGLQDYPSKLSSTCLREALHWKYRSWHSQQWPSPPEHKWSRRLLRLQRASHHNLSRPLIWLVTSCNSITRHSVCSLYQKHASNESLTNGGENLCNCIEGRGRWPVQHCRKIKHSDCSIDCEEHPSLL